MKLEKTYQPHLYENDIYQKWEQAAAFKSSSNKNQLTFSTVLPPPNANADLHLGYALDTQLKDILGRFYRLKNYSVLLLPGADHAGFETWAVFEKHLNAQNKSRFDFKKEDLYQQVYDFVIKNMQNMKGQIKRLGISCDWQKFTFSLDDNIVKQSYQTFAQMWREGLIYRGKRIVNYCTHHGTGFSDIEVNHQEKAGHLWYIKYPLKNDRKKFITIATTRPETMLGDVAVAVHPKDERYIHLQNQTVILPLTQREIPIISDERVLTDFGTGAVKITPAHDELDFKIGQTHQLQPLSIINEKGQITDLAPPEFQGMEALKARELVVKKLEKEGCLQKVEEHSHQVGCCYKCQTVLQPLLIDQWFVRMQPLAKEAIKVLKQNKIKFYPSNKKLELIQYFKQLEDWNISRQIVWGIPLPIFQNQKPPHDWLYDEKVTQKTLRVNDKTYQRDPDVFDTWWSSSHWPVAAINWQKEKEFYPQSLMETGVDILKPWVSRMIVLSLYITQQIPFKTVYLHGMIVDEQGVKMSKSKGNVVNPLTVIKDYGADALRISLCGRTTAGQPQRFTQAKVLAGRNFCNKFWNIGRFVQNSAADSQTGYLQLIDNFQLKSGADHWIWRQFLFTRNQVETCLKNYQFTHAWDFVFNFIWNDLADWYLEIHKKQSNPSFLSQLFINVLKLLHPFAPFLTEILYQKLNPNSTKPLLINCVWDEDFKSTTVDEQKIKDFKDFKDLISRIRQLLPLDLRQQAELVFKDLTADDHFLDLIKHLTQIKEIAIERASPKNGLYLGSLGQLQAWLVLPLKTIKNQLQKLNEDKQVLDLQIVKLNKRLQNEAYLKKAPPHLVEDSQNNLKDLNESLNNLKTTIQKFERALI